MNAWMKRNGSSGIVADSTVSAAPHRVLISVG
jgi:hypothetical protein